MKKPLENITVDNKIQKQLSILTQLEFNLTIILKINDLKALRENSELKIQEYEKKLQDHYYQEFFDRVDDHLNIFPIKVKQYLQKNSDDNIIKRYISILIEANDYLAKLFELNKYRENININKIKLEKQSSTDGYSEKYSEVKSELVQQSITLFNNLLENKMIHDIVSFRQNVKDYFKNWKDSILSELFKSLKDKVGIWVTTNLSTRYNLPNMPAIFDYLIIDEASQNDMASIIPLLFRAQKAIIIGDPHQLKHITSLTNKIVQNIANKHKIGDKIIDFHYNKNSAYDLAERRFIKHKQTPAFVLKDHYRCHEEIIGFSNIQFYNSKLFAKTFLKSDIYPLQPGVKWKHIKGNYNNKSNKYEAAAVGNFIEGLFHQGLKNNISIGIITPFNNQKNLISSILLRKKINFGKENDRISVSTVHKFQGDEKDIIIYSPVFSDGITKGTLSWLDRSTDLLNVAITRARSALIIIGDSQYCLSTNGLHRKLLDYCSDCDRKKTNIIFESKPEEIFYNTLKKNKFQFEYQVPIGKYRIDFLMKMTDRYLCVELDGGQHESTKSYDYSKDSFLKGIGYDVKRFPNSYINEDLNGIIESLKRICIYNN